MTTMARFTVNYDVDEVSKFSTDCLKISQKSCFNIDLHTLSFTNEARLFTKNSTGASNQVEVTAGRNEEKQGASRSSSEGEWPR